MYLISLLTISCQKLDEKPFSSLSVANLYQNEADVDRAILGIYDPQQNPFFDFDLMLLTTAPSEHAVVRFKESYQGKYSSFSSDANDPAINDIWTQMYLGINRANTVIDNVKRAGLEQSIENEKIAECKFMRAYYYFHLVRLFGGVPLHLTETTDFSDEALKKPRNTIEEVYNTILDDLTFAEQYLPNVRSAANLGRATNGAAKSILGKVYLTMAGKPLLQTNRYQDAVTKLKEVVDNRSAYGYELLNNYSDIFSDNTEFNSEVIYAVPSIRQFADGNLLTFFAGAPNCTWAYSGGQYQFGFSLDFYNSYSETDLRKNSALIYSYVDLNGNKVTYNDPNNSADLPFGGYKDPSGIVTGKLKDSGNKLNPFTHDNDQIYLRYADVLLMLSEAYNETGNSGNALLYVNMIRKRAGLVNITTADQAQLKLKIRQERNWELVGEFTEFYDLQRWGIIKDIISKSPDAIANHVSYNIRQELYPIPQSQINANPNLKQNPGY